MKNSSPGRQPLFSPHRHTGKVLPHRHTSYPFVTFLLLVLGVLLWGWTINVNADSFTVTGKVAAPLPSDPAIITSPANGASFVAVPITVSGTCPLNSYIKLFRNNVFSGTTLCQADNSFSLQTDLFSGNNDLTAHVFNITDDEGPLSPAVGVTYNPPISSTPPATSTNIPTGESTPFVIIADNKYQGFYTGDNVAWKLDITGGVPPYAVSVDWGDGFSSLLSQAESGEFTVNHVYKQPGGFKGEYQVKIKASDAAGHETFLQLVILVNNRNAIPSLVAGSVQPPRSINTALKFLWPTYSIVVLMAASFWLGQRQLLRRMGQQLLLTHHRRS